MDTVVSLSSWTQKIFTETLLKMLKKGFNTSSYDLERLLLKGKNKKVISLMKDEWVGKIMKEFVRLRAKT